MTQETMETLEQMYAYAASRAEWHPSLMDITDPGWDEDDLVECVEASARWGRRALALRDVLTPRTCSTCRWVRHLPDEQFIGETAPVCASEDESHPLHWCSPIGDAETFGCTSWQAREGEGGEG